MQYIGSNLDWGDARVRFKELFEERGPFAALRHTAIPAKIDRALGKSAYVRNTIGWYGLGVAAGGGGGYVR